MTTNEEQGYLSFDTNAAKKRKIYNADGEPVALIGDIDDWSCLYQKQDNLEKLRLYYATISWSLVSKVYPRHVMLKEFHDVILSSEFMSQKLQKFAKDIDDPAIIEIGIKENNNRK